MNTDAKLEDLQAVSQHMLESVARIKALEAEKRTVEANSPRFRELSNQIESLAEEMRRVSRAETALADELSDEPNVPSVDEAEASNS